MEAFSRLSGPFRRAPIQILVLSGYLIVLGLIWLDEAVHLPHVLLGAPEAAFCWQAALLRSAVMTGVALLMGLVLVGLVRTRRTETGLRQTAERALETSEAHLLRAQEVASVGSWDLDLTTGRLYWSDEVYRIFGVPRGTPLDYGDFLDAIVPDDRDLVDRSWKAALRGGHYDLEHRIHVGGRVKWVREKAEVELDREGRAARGIGIVQDITARKEAEEDAARLEAELAHVTRVATLGEFAAALAHELNQPLAAILGNAQAALRFLAAGSLDPGELREILEDIVADDQRARDVILKLRELTRKPADRQERAPLAVGPLVEGVLRIARGDLALRRVVADLDLADDAMPVSANAIQLQQAILNLVLNALEAMEESEVRRLTVRTRNAGDKAVEIVVADTGCGFDPADAQTFTRPFVTTKEHGMGMGLAITRAVAESHGGCLRADSPAGGGAEFAIVLPALEAAA